LPLTTLQIIKRLGLFSCFAKSEVLVTNDVIWYFSQQGRFQGYDLMIFWHGGPGEDPELGPKQAATTAGTARRQTMTRIKLNV
jgi:hypothetical protein